uniref:Colipase N-terminal domain-containing protein n=1 Tax=Lynx canadensis TaxID=61383 RepID=A0A667GLF2_LYNCA
MTQLLLLVLLSLLPLFFLLTSGSFGRARINYLDDSEICVQSKKCKSGCCRRETEGCESHCAPGSEGSTRHTQTFLGLYNECPRLPNLTCVFPKNEKSFNIIYGRCKKIEKRKSAKNIFF